MAIRLPIAMLLACVIGLPMGCRGGTPAEPPPASGSRSLVTAVVPVAGYLEVGAAVTFRAESTTTLQAWVWTFEGATPERSIFASPTVIIRREGTITGTVVVYGPGGPEPPFPFEIAIGPPTAHLPAISEVLPDGPAAGIEGEAVQFSARVTGAPTSWHWEIGVDSEQLSLDVEKPFIVLGRTGHYEGTVTASNDFGTSEPFRFRYFVAPYGVPVITSVSPSGLVLTPGFDHTFVATTTKDVSKWQWDFGNLTERRFSTAREPVMRIASAGDFIVKVVATGQGGDSPLFEFPVHVDSHPQAPVVLAIDQRRQGRENIIQGVATNNPTRWHWDFGEARPPISTKAVTGVRSAQPLNSGSVAACNDFGCSERVPFVFEGYLLSGAPHAVDVTPRHLHGNQGDVVTFEAEAPWAETFEWDFGGGATPNTASGRSVSVTLGIAGTYDATVVADGPPGVLYEEFTFRVSPTQPPIVQSVTLPESMLSGTLARFETDAANFPTSWRWEFGDGARPGSAVSGGFNSDPETSVLLGTPGRYTGQAYASNEFGESEAFEFEYEITGPAAVAWSNHLIAENVNYGVSALAVGGKPALAFWKGKDLIYARANTAFPRHVQDWSGHKVADTDYPGGIQFRLVGGRPTIFYRTGLPGQSFVEAAHASTDQPIHTDDWHGYELTAAELIMLHPLDIDGKPALLVWDWEHHWITTPAVSEPRSANDWRHYAIPFGPSMTGVASHVALTEHAGELALAFGGRHEHQDFPQLHLARGRLGEDHWQHAGLQLYRTSETWSLLSVDGRLVILMAGVAKTATEEWPGSPGDWVPLTTEQFSLLSTPPLLRDNILLLPLDDYQFGLNSRLFSVGRLALPDAGSTELELAPLQLNVNAAAFLPYADRVGVATMGKDRKLYWNLSEVW